MTRIQLRRGTAAQWTSVNPVLASGEMGIETDTNKFKFGDGTTAWNSLDYVITGEVITDYTELDNLPSINNITLTGNKSASDLGLQEELTNGTGILISGNTISVDDSVVAMQSDIPDVSNFVTNSSLSTTLQDYQPLLESGTNIKTINNLSLLGSGNIEIQSGGTYSEGTGIDISNGVISIDTNVVATLNDIPDLTDYVTNSSLSTTLLNYATQSDISDMATKTWVGQQGYLVASDLNGYATESFVTNQGYITGITSSDVITALGYTPYDSTNPNGYITASALTPYALSANLATVATSGSYNDLTNKPTIPSTANMVTTDTDQTISGIKTFSDLRVYQYIRNIDGKIIFYGVGGSFSIGNTTCELTLDGSRTRPHYYDGTTNSEIALLSDIPTVPTVDQIYDSTSTNPQSGTAVEEAINTVKIDLNGKADTDLSNTTDQAKILMSGMGMPSNRYIDLTLGASGTRYTAPANGWVLFHFSTTTATNYAYGLRNYSTFIQHIIRNTSTGVEIAMYIPVKKDDIFTAVYEARVNLSEFRFIYAQGSESEAS